VAEQGEECFPRSAGARWDPFEPRGCVVCNGRLNLLILWFNVYYTSVVKGPTFLARFDAVFELKLLLLVLSAAALGFLRLMLCRLRPSISRADRLESLDSPGQHAPGATRQIIEAGLPMPGWKFVLWREPTGRTPASRRAAPRYRKG